VCHDDSFRSVSSLFRQKTELPERLYIPPPCFAGVTLVKGNINTQVAPIAGSNDMVWISTWRITETEMRHGEYDHAVRPLCGLSIPFNAAPGAGMGAMQSAWPSTCTLPVGPFLANALTQGFPL